MFMDCLGLFCAPNKFSYDQCDTSPIHVFSMIIYIYMNKLEGRFQLILTGFDLEILCNMITNRLGNLNLTHCQQYNPFLTSINIYLL